MSTLVRYSPHTDLALQQAHAGKAAKKVRAAARNKKTHSSRRRGARLALRRPSTSPDAATPE